MIVILTAALAFQVPPCQVPSRQVPAAKLHALITARPRGEAALRPSVWQPPATRRALRCRGGSLELATRLPSVPVGVVLAVCIATEVFGVTCLRLAADGPKLWMAGTALGYATSFSLFTVVLQKMPLGVAYAIWSGVGTAATAVISAVLFGETFGVKKLLATATIMVGVLALNLS